MPRSLALIQAENKPWGRWRRGEACLDFPRNGGVGLRCFVRPVMG